MAVALRLDIDLGSAHVCRCGANVDPSGVHSLVCRQTTGRATRHLALSDCIFRALRAAGIPASKEPSGLVRTGGKRPDGCTLMVQWQVHRMGCYDSLHSGRLLPCREPGNPYSRRAGYRCKRGKIINQSNKQTYISRNEAHKIYIDTHTPTTNYKLLTIPVKS